MEGAFWHSYVRTYKAQLSSKSMRTEAVFHLNSRLNAPLNLKIHLNTFIRIFTRNTPVLALKVSKGAKIRSRYNQVPHPTQDTNGKVTKSQLDTTNESQEVSPFPAVDHKAQINRRAQRHSKHKTEQKHKRSTKEVPPWNRQ